MTIGLEGMNNKTAHTDPFAMRGATCRTEGVVLGSNRGPEAIRRIEANAAQYRGVGGHSR